MSFILGTSIKAGQKVIHNGKWRKLTRVDENGAYYGKTSEETLIPFGSPVGGWKYK